MARKVFNPHSQKESEREIYRDQENFSGMVEDPPHSEIPDTALSLVRNAVCYPRYMQGRNGHRLYSSATWPALEGRTGYTLTQSGTTVTGNANFAETDVSNYVVIGGYHLEITEFVSASEVRVDEAGTRTSTNAYLRGRVNGRVWHRTRRQMVFHLGDEFWYADDLAISGYTRIIIVSHSEPANATSMFDEDGEDLICWTSSGIFKIVLDAEVPYAFRRNTEVPAIPPDSNDPPSRLQTHERRYLYAMGRLTGQTNLRHRETSGVLIEQESGTTAINPERDDYASVWTQDKVGDGTKTNGELRCAQLAAADLDVTGVWGVIANGTFVFTYNYEDGSTRTVQIWVDFTQGDLYAMSDVAGVIERFLQAHFPDATCNWEEDRFVFTSGEIDGTTIEFLGDGVGGNNIADNLQGRAADGAVLSRAHLYETPNVVQFFRNPVVSSDPGVHEYHWTHYAIYAAKTDVDLGDNPDAYVWLFDLRIAGAFFAEKDATGLVTATYGEFEERDEGSILEWEDGDRDEIITYVSSTQIRTAPVNTTSPDYEEAKRLQACAIGNGRVFRGSQTGNTVSRTRGEQFTSADVRKTIFWSTGQRSYITEFVNGNEVRVHDSQTRPSQGFTMDPVRRKFNDTVSDDIIDARINTGSWVLQTRRWRPIPLTNIGVQTSGFMFAIVRRGSDVYYSAFDPTFRYIAGYYYPESQVDTTIKDEIIYIAEYTNRVVVFCANRWYFGPTNASDIIEIEGTGQNVVVFKGFQVGGEIGILDYGSFRQTDLDQSIMVTSEPGVRQFDGYRFGPNEAEDQKSGLEAVMDELRSWQAATNAVYDSRRSVGYVVWGRR